MQGLCFQFPLYRFSFFRAGPQISRRISSFRRFIDYAVLDISWARCAIARYREMHQALGLRHRSKLVISYIFISKCLSFHISAEAHDGDHFIFRMLFICIYATRRERRERHSPYDAYKFHSRAPFRLSRHFIYLMMTFQLYFSPITPLTANAAPRHCFKCFAPGYHEFHWRDEFNEMKLYDAR